MTYNFYVFSCTTRGNIGNVKLMTRYEKKFKKVSQLKNCYNVFIFM